MIKMADLREIFVAADADDVATYIQSGNVVFTHAARSEPTLAAELEKRIAKAAGFSVPVVLRTAGQLARVIGQSLSRCGCRPPARRVLGGAPSGERADRRRARVRAGALCGCRPRALPVPTRRNGPFKARGRRPRQAEGDRGRRHGAQLAHRVEAERARVGAMTGPTPKAALVAVRKHALSYPEARRGSSLGRPGNQSTHAA